MTIFQCSDETHEDVWGCLGHWTRQVVVVVDAKKNARMAVIYSTLYLPLLMG